MRIDRWKVRRQMERVGISRFGDLAKEVGVSPQTVSAWFRGAGFTSDSLAALCDALDCSPNEILTIDPNRHAPAIVPKRASELVIA